MESVFADLRFALRQLVRHRTFTLAAVLTLGLAIGANTAIFSVVSGVLLRPLPFPHPDRLVTVCERHPSVAGFCIASTPDVEDWAAQSRTLESVGLGREWPFTMGTAGETESVSGGLATPGLFRALGIEAAAGRLFSADEVGPAAAVAVLSDGLWRSRFGADRGIVGRTITLDAQPYTVVGVLPAGLTVPGLKRVQVWTSLPFNPRDEDRRSWRGFEVIGRLAESATPATAAAELRAIERSLGERFPETNRGWGVDVIDLRESEVGDVRPRLLVFLGAVGLVLLLGCTNLANMMLARTAARSRELAVRAAIGASRGRVARLLLIESALLAVLSGAAGLLIALWGTDALLRLAPAGIPRLDEVGLDWRVVVFALGLVALTTLLFGLAPAWRGAAANLSQALRQAGTGARSGRGRSLLVAAETAIAVTLLIGAGLLLRSFATMLAWDPGFERNGLAVGSTFLSPGDFPTRTSVLATFERGLDALRGTPGITGATLASAGPLFGGTETGTVRSGGMDSAVARWYDVGPAYFGTMGIPLQRGRDFTPADRAGAPAVAIVNATLAARLWPHESALGKHVTMPDERPDMEIVGVAADVRPLNPDQPVEPEIWWPFFQETRWASFFVVRSGGAPAATARLVRARLETVSHDLAPGTLRSMDEMLGREMVSPRFNVLLIGAFAAVALALAVVGLGGLIAYGVVNRTKEIGIRLALGATAGMVVRRFVREGAVLVGAGACGGVLGALALTRFLRTMLSGTSPTDPLTFAGILAVVALTGLLAAWLPARRAGKVDPLAALRAE